MGRVLFVLSIFTTMIWAKYTLAICNTKDINNANIFIKTHLQVPKDDIYIYKIKNRYSTTYGLFDSRDEVHEFKLKLSKKLQATKPFIVNVNRFDGIAKVIKLAPEVVKVPAKVIEPKKEYIQPKLAMRFVEEPKYIEEKKQLNKKQPEAKEKKNKLFLSLAVGNMTSSVSTDLESNKLVTGALDTEGNIVDFTLGKIYDKNIFATISAQQANLEIVTIRNLYATLNYQLNNMLLNPYIGGIFGFSHITWKEIPVTNSLEEDLLQAEWIYGLQAGLEYNFTNKKTFFIQMQYLDIHHNMDVNYGANYIKHTTQNNILFGYKFRFNKLL